MYQFVCGVAGGTHANHLKDCKSFCSKGNSFTTEMSCVGLFAKGKLSPTFLGQTIVIVPNINCLTIVKISKNFAMTEVL